MAVTRSFKHVEPTKSCAWAEVFYLGFGGRGANVFDDEHLKLALRAEWRRMCSKLCTYPLSFLVCPCGVLMSRMQLSDCFC